MAGSTLQYTGGTVVSSKWLVFKRPFVAGFERPLTVTVKGSFSPNCFNDKWLRKLSPSLPSLPESMVVREIRYPIRERGRRTRVVTLVTTLLDAEIYPAQEIAWLYSATNASTWERFVTAVQKVAARPDLRALLGCCEDASHDTLR